MTALSMEISSKRDHGSAANRVKPRSVSALSNAVRTKDSVSGAYRSNAIRIVEVEKRKIPAFQRCMPPLRRASAATAFGFSTNEETGSATGANSSDGLEESANQPNPVSARSGRMPKVTI